MPIRHPIKLMSELYDLVSEEFETAVTQVVKSEGKGNKQSIRCKSRHILPLGFAAAAAKLPEQLIVSRTFVLYNFEERSCQCIHAGLN